MKKIVRKIVLSFICVVTSLSLFAEYNKYGLSDSTEIRRKLVDSYFTCNVDSLRTKQKEIFTNEIGERFQVSVEETSDCFAICVIPEQVISLEEYGSSVVKNVTLYDAKSKGSWILFRDKKTGEGKKIQLYFQQEEDVFLEFSPDGNKTLVDMIICGDYAALSVPMGIRFSKLYTSSFAEIQNWTKSSLPWNYVTILTDQYNDSLVMIKELTKYQQIIEPTEYACYNEKNELCSYLTGDLIHFYDDEGEEIPLKKGRKYLSDAGFLKWICDSIVSVYTDENIPIKAITESTVVYDDIGKNGVLSQNYTLTFSLDWCRNLAYICHESKSTALYGFEKNQVDVTSNFFVASYGNKKNNTINSYMKDTGYKISNIKSLLYVLAVTEPSNFYLGAIKEHSKVKPDDFTFNDCVAIFPYFDSKGNFYCKILQGNKEISLNEFMDLYSDCFIHLERIKCSKYLMFQ